MSKKTAAVDRYRLQEFLRGLVDIYSPTGKEEEALEFVCDHLNKHGLTVTRQSVDDSRYNILVLPEGTEPLVAFVGHLDTVSAYDLEDYGFKSDGEIVEGLGAADMKGGCAAMVEAFLSLKESTDTEVPAALCLVVGEEEEGDGAERLVEEYHFPWAIIGEPTDMRVCMSCYGYLETQFQTNGKRMHASLADAGRNPIEALLRLVLQISHYVENQRPELVYNVRDLYSSQAGYAVPDRCEVWVDFHAPPVAPLGEITMELEELVEREREAYSSVEFDFRIGIIDSGYELPGRGRVAEALKKTFEKRGIPWEPQAFKSHSDANRLWAAGIRPILLGPGQLEKAHAPDESIPFSQVIDAAGIYLDLLCAVTRPPSDSTVIGEIGGDRASSRKELAPGTPVYAHPR